MNLGNKTLNDLISKDNSAAKGAAIKLLAEKDVESFKILNSKSEFLFDFIKEKILKLSRSFSAAKEAAIKLLDEKELESFKILKSK